MRLLKLRVKNIASLKGEHTISFEDIAAHSNLFAITGETGAGKSTILNSVGLALYGDIFKKTLNQIDVVSLGEYEGMIELIFQVRGKKYLAYWYVRTRKPNGEAYAKVPTPTRYLYTLAGNDFTSERTISEEKVEDLLNLDFDQFSKCVVLNQGEFAKFLMSSFPERRAILEKLYPGELLGNIVRVLKEELDSLRVQKEHLEIELKAISDDGQSHINIEQELISARRELALHESWSELIEQLFDHFQSLLHYHEKNLENEKRIDSTKRDLASGTSSYNILLKATEEAQQRREESQKALNERGPRLQELLKSEENLRNEKSRLETLSKDDAKIRTELLDLDQRIERLRTEETKLLPEREETAKKMKYPFESIIAHRDSINNLVDRSEEIGKIRQALQLEQERLSNLENKGIEVSAKSQEIQDKLKLIPEDTSEQLKAHLKKKDESLKSHARETEITFQTSSIEILITELIMELKSRKDKVKDFKEELVNVVASLKVQELLSAVSVCLFHPQTEEKNICPVCENPFGKGKLQDLKILAGSFNIGRLQQKSDKLNADIVKLDTEIELQSKSLTDEQRKLSLLKEEKTKLRPLLVPVDEFEKEIARIQKLSWDRDQLLPLALTTEAELKKVRLEYRDAKAKLTTKETELEEKRKLFHQAASEISPFVPDFNEDLLPVLRLDLRLSVLLSELDGMIERHRHDLKHWGERKTELNSSMASIIAQKEEARIKIQQLSELLMKELEGGSASEALKKLNENMRVSLEEFDNKDRDRRKQELVLKDFQSRLYTYDEQARDIGIQYSKEHTEIIDLAQKEIPELSLTLSQIRDTLKKIDLPLSSPSGLFVPLKEIMEKEKGALKLTTNEARSRVAHFVAKKEDQEKKRDRIQLLELKRADVMKDLARRERMNEILGKDELRTYVLSLVEENLIIVTNEELARLCQSRYEIIHQTKTNKLAPEFFILDKFRDGGIRKISTLSGGETFMVSLAMALGLAEMTRGTAEIDTLFIDEGFGTLDQDSLEDVLDMLNQIQNRGLMVGIISHVKALTSTLPINLHVQKRQDGTSTVKLVVN